MLRHHIPQIVSQVGVTSRYFLGYLHFVSRTVLLALARFESPRQALRLALEQGRASGARSLLHFGQGLRTFPLLIHYHIFKNAGTSFEWALEKVLGRGLQRYDKGTDGFISKSDLATYIAGHPDVRAIATHQAAPPPPQVRGRQLFTSILIRDPIARIRSIYAFERSQQAEGIGATKAKELDFKGYVEWRLGYTPRMFCNYQVLFCIRGESLEGVSLGQAELARAIAILDQVDIVGTVERYQEWLSLAESVLADSFDAITLTTAHHNQTRVAATHSESEILGGLCNDLGSDLAHHLLEENELDMCLHQVADSLLSRRLAERSLMVKLRDAYGSVRAAREAAADRQS